MNSRRIVNYCYDHLGGILGEAIFEFLIKEKWIQKNNDNEYDITDKGWEELEILGVAVEKLNSKKRKIVNSCRERHHGIYHEHTGSHLGSLIADLLVENKWILKNGEDNPILTKKGLRGLHSLGVSTKNINEKI